MSAAATAAGYLYASGRLRNKNKQEQEKGWGGDKPTKEQEFSKKKNERIEDVFKDYHVDVVATGRTSSKQPVISNKPKRNKLKGISHPQTDKCGFDRNSSISEDRYVCMCGWADPFQE